MAEYYVAWAPHHSVAFVAATAADAKRIARDAIKSGWNEPRLTWPMMRKAGWRVSKIGDDADAG